MTGEPSTIEAAVGGEASAQMPPVAAAPRSRDNLALRIASALVLGPTAILMSWIGGPPFAGLVAFLCVLMAFEWARMIERAELSAVFFCLAIGGAIALILAAGERYEFAYGVCGLTAIAAGLAALGGSRDWAAAGFGAVYFIAPSVALIWLRENAEYGRGFLLLLFAIVWAADTGGYVGGRLVGGPKLSPRISPAKTWAGAVGGIIFGGAAATVFTPIFLKEGSLAVYFAVGAGLGFASILGDMAESGIKRRFGIKDMSGFVPGHGGVLDRLDGMIFATAAVTAAIYVNSLGAGFGK